MTMPDDKKPPGFDPKDAAFAMNRADEMEHVQGIADRNEVTSVSAAPGLLEGPPPVVKAPRPPPKPLPRSLPDALALGSGVLALACVLSVSGSAIGEAFALPEGVFFERLFGGGSKAPIAGTPALAQSVRETPTSEPRPPTAAEASSESYSGFGMLVDSTPEGAVVRVDGEDLGKTPLALGSVECRWNEPLVITIEHTGWKAWSYQGTCATDSMLHLTAKLRR